MIAFLVSWFWTIFRFVVPDRVEHCTVCGEPIGFVPRFSHRWHWVHANPKECGYRQVRALALALFAFLSVASGALAQANDDTPLGNNTLVLWLAVLAIITAGATSLINQLPPRFSTTTKRIIAAVVALALAVGDAFYRETLDVTNWTQTWLIVFLAASGFYVVLMKPISSALSKG